MNKNKLNNIQVKYSSIARPPFNIDINQIYTIILKDDDTYIVNGYYTNQINTDILIEYFQPLNTSWNEILAKDTSDKKKKTKNNDNSIELIEEKLKTEIE